MHHHIGRSLKLSGQLREKLSVTVSECVICCDHHFVIAIRREPLMKKVELVILLMPRAEIRYDESSIEISGIENAGIAHWIGGLVHAATAHGIEHHSRDAKPHMRLNVVRPSRQDVTVFAFR